MKFVKLKKEKIVTDTEDDIIDICCDDMRKALFPEWKDYFPKERKKSIWSKLNINYDEKTISISVAKYGDYDYYHYVEKEIKFCPFCGKPILEDILQPLKKKGWFKRG